MGLLDSVIGAIGGQGGGGGNAALLNMVVGMLTQQGGGAAAGGAGGLGGALGGLGGLLGQLQQGGLGHVADSWVGTGQNLPISPDQLGGALGHDTVSNMANQLGMNHGDLLGQLSQLLPQVVDKLTPNGQVPQAGAGGLGGMDLGSLLGGLLKG
jgi:uncharacterized protein YidB (DUF937 family)